MLSEANERLQQQLTQLRSQKAKLSSQLEFNSKRYDMLQETVSAYRRQMAALQEQSTKMAATEQSHEHIIHTLTQDLRAANEKLALAEVRRGRGGRGRGGRGRERAGERGLGR